MMIFVSAPEVLPIRRWPLNPPAISARCAVPYTISTVTVVPLTRSASKSKSEKFDVYSGQERTLGTGRADRDRSEGAELVDNQRSVFCCVVSRQRK